MDVLKGEVPVDVAAVTPAVPPRGCSITVVAQVVYGPGGRVLLRPDEGYVMSPSGLDGGEDDVADEDILLQERAEQECIAASEKRNERTFA